MQELRGVLIFFVSMIVLLVSGTFFSYLGYEWDILRQVGPGLVIYDLGTVIEAHSGFLRSPELAAWHSSVGICIAIVLAVSATRRKTWVLASLVVLMLLGAGLLTGRRKMLMIVLLFLIIYGALLLLFRRGMARLSVIITVAAAVGTWLVLEFQATADTEYDLYIRRGATVLEAAPPRVSQFGMMSVVYAIQRYGLFGIGAGTGSQGAQHFGGGSNLAGGQIEGGLGKIVTELGLAGLVLFLWLLVSLARRIWCLLQIADKDSYVMFSLVAGLVAFIVANLPAYMIAAQAYGDPFVLLILGILLGFVLSTPRFLDPRTTAVPRVSESHRVTNKHRKSSSEGTSRGLQPDRPNAETGIS